MNKAQNQSNSQPLDLALQQGITQLLQQSGSNSQLAGLLTSMNPETLKAFVANPQALPGVKDHIWPGVESSGANGAGIHH